MSRLQAVVIALAALNVAVVVEAVRRRRMRESFALLWLGIGVGGVALAAARPLVDRLARALGIAFGTSLVFAVVILALVYICLLLSIHISRLHDDVEALAEEIALLRGVSEPEAVTESEDPDLRP